MISRLTLSLRDAGNQDTTPSGYIYGLAAVTTRLNTAIPSDSTPVVAHSTGDHGTRPRPVMCVQYHISLFICLANIF